MNHISALTLALLFSISSFCQSFIRSELPTEVNRPWEITYGPDGFLWLTEKDGNVSRVDPVTGDKQIVFTANDYFPGSDLENSAICPGRKIGVGTLGLTLHPQFLNPSTAYIYFLYSYNHGTESEPYTRFRVKRLTWDATNETVVANTNLIDSITTGLDHLGGRLLAVERNGQSHLYLSLGDNGVSEQNSPECYDPQSTNPNNFTQDPATQNGKIHRFNMDGSIPADNPIPGNSFFTRGHRNPQGLMYNTRLDLLYDIEHGDRTDDEINILESGMNYGWKQVRGYHNDDSFDGEADFVSNYTPHPSIANDALKEPFYSWCTTRDTSDQYTEWCTVAPSDGIYYDSPGIPQWTNSLLVVTLKDGLSTDREVHLFRLQENGELVASTQENPNPTTFFGEDQAANGRLRDITYSPDGKRIYLINNGGTDRDKITVYELDPDGVASTAEQKEIHLFPNPVEGYLTLANFSGSAASLSLFNVMGNSIPLPSLQENQLDVSNLAPGCYILHFEKNGQPMSKRFLKL